MMMPLRSLTDTAASGGRPRPASWLFSHAVLTAALTSPATLPVASRNGWAT